MYPVPDTTKSILCVVPALAYAIVGETDPVLNVPWLTPSTYIVYCCCVPAVGVTVIVVLVVKVYAYA